MDVRCTGCLWWGHEEDGIARGVVLLCPRCAWPVEAWDSPRAIMGHGETSDQDQEATETPKEGEEVDATRTQNRKQMARAQRQQSGDVGARDGEGRPWGDGSYFDWVKAGLEEEVAQEEEEGEIAFTKVRAAADIINAAMIRIFHLVAENELEAARQVSLDAAQLVNSLVGSGGGEA